jgi:hypothetical protein
MLGVPRSRWGASRSSLGAEGKLDDIFGLVALDADDIFGLVALDAD